jgi:hypothetical protein
MYQTGYHATGYYSTDYYIHGVVLPPVAPGGGGGHSAGPGHGHGPGALPSPRPSIDKNQPLYLQQALQEDEELILILKAFTEVIRWH